MENLSAFFFGTEYADRMQKFDADIEEIENKNSDLFEERKLSGHYFVSTFQNNTVRIVFTDDDLPQRIVKQVLDLFESFFPKQ